MTIFKQIIEMRSMTLIHYLCEDYLKENDYEIILQDEIETIRKIFNTNSLDEAWLFAYEYLGNEEEATKLRQWLAKKASRVAQMHSLSAPDDYFPELE